MSKKTLTVLLWGIALSYPIGWLLSEVRWSRVNNPKGRFTTVSEYLAQNRQPSRVCRIERDGASFYIAHGPRDFWLAVPSDPAAYVFDENGQLIDWSADPGDGRGFDRNWPLDQQEEASVNTLRRLGG